ncbi:beta-1,3-galactosyl-O-glycosyl-glycoprotein beta-1,6-N-acetylglucosaminyltransferase-like [Lineus longissimus]|uniref:beta-1,3-galactosyl-O-glycosyl-glycoprotein beta-1,6-N-acetylglucosaminyltransferase-like n=1 Tax=Lineus longissimus TaxID=88925 RepID=UPI002B4EEBC2
MNCRRQCSLLLTSRSAVIKVIVYAAVIVIFMELLSSVLTEKNNVLRSVDKLDSNKQLAPLVSLVDRVSNSNLVLPGGAADDNNKVTAAGPIKKNVDPAVPERKLKFSPFCPKLFANDKSAIEAAHKYMAANPRTHLTPANYSAMAKECGKFIHDRGYITSPLSQEEADFPIAFGIVIFKDIEQVERLLRAIYQPQHLYCIHVDVKSPSDYYAAVKSIADCFPNVFMSSKRESVRWGTWSVLQADLNCIEDLYRHKQKWKYLINLTGQEMPMVSNRQLVRVLKAYNGANDIEGTFKRKNKERTTFVYKNDQKTKDLLSPPPYNITPMKGSLHIVASRGYIDFILHSMIAKAFTEWLRDTGIPDETFFSTMNHNPHLGVPGSYKGEPETHPVNKPFMTRYKNWGIWPFDYGQCYGKRVRLVCVNGIGDLWFLKPRKELFINKFHLDYQYLALDCWEQLQYNRTVESSDPGFQFDDSYYRGLSFVKDKVVNPAYTL